MKETYFIHYKFLSKIYFVTVKTTICFEAIKSYFSLHFLTNNWLSFIIGRNTLLRCYALKPELLTPHFNRQLPAIKIAIKPSTSTVCSCELQQQYQYFPVWLVIVSRMVLEVAFLYGGLLDGDVG